MNIQKKTSLILITAILFYAFILIITSNFLWNNQLVSLDNEAASIEHEIIETHLKKELNSLALILKDYARWDETYKFINTRDNSYITNNYLGVDLNNFSYAAIYDNNGQLRASFKIIEDGSIIPWEYFPKKIDLNSLWYDTSIENIRKGFLKTDTEVLLIASAPILLNNSSENSNGILIFAKTFSEKMKKALAQDTKITNSLKDVSVKKNYDLYSETIKNIENSENTYFDVSDKNTIKSYSLIYDIQKKPLFILETETSKQHELVGKNIQFYTGLSTIIFTLIILFIVYQTIHHIIIKPLKLLQKIFRHIASDSEIPKEYFLKLYNKHDEISELTDEFKSMNSKIFDLNHNLENIVKERTAQLRNANDNLRLTEKIIENTMEGIMVTDLEGHIIKINRGFLTMTDFTEEEVIGQSPKILKSGRHTKEFYKNMWKDVEKTGIWSGEIWNRKKDGTVYPKWLTINTINDDNGSPVYYVGLLTDISKLKDAEMKLNHLAYYDSLTALPNRTLFYERLKQSINFNKRYKKRLAVFFIDLDRFKNINDSLGHNIGDDYLIEISKRIKGRIRESDTVCRVGGDEFLIILDKFDYLDDIAAVASDLLKIIKNPVMLANQEIISTASLGIALFPDDDNTEEGLIRKADIAMYLAKNSGRSSYKFFSQELEDLNNAKLSLETELRKALEKNKFKLYFQPQVNVEKYLKGENSVIGCEALIRWIKDDGSVVPPDLFIPLAEETGLIIPIGKWVLEEACRTGAKWYNEGTPVRVSANVSAIQFADPNFLVYLDEALEATGLPPNLLHLELTESLLLCNMESTIGLLNKLRNRGILFSLDDFGTGYSSLSYIKELPASNLKIDKGFIFKMDSSSQDKALVQVIISIAKTFGMTSIAEGVETREHLEELYHMGCEEVQGYYISKPLPLSDFEKFINENSIR